MVAIVVEEMVDEDVEDAVDATVEDIVELDWYYNKNKFKKKILAPLIQSI